jgi:hypothetical protein
MNSDNSIVELTQVSIERKYQNSSRLSAETVRKHRQNCEAHRNKSNQKRSGRDRLVGQGGPKLVNGEESYLKLRTS